MPGGLHPSLADVQSWPKPNPHDPPIRQNGFLITCIVLMAVTTIIVAARLYARCIIQRKCQIDDYLIVVAHVFALGMGIGICLALESFGFDRHIWDAIENPDLLERGRQVVWVIEMTNVLSTGFARISILCFILRITRSTLSRQLVWTVYAFIIFVSTTTVIYVTILFVECRPFYSFWKQVNIVWLMEGNDFHCIDEGAKLLSAGIISTVQDFMVATLPVCMFWNLSVPLGKKVAIWGIFGVGYIVCVVGIVRAFYTHKIFYDTYDVTWETPKLFLWTHIELYLGIICASAPALKCFFRSLRSGDLGTKFNHGRKTKQSTKARQSMASPLYGGAGMYTQELHHIDFKPTTRIHMGKSEESLGYPSWPFREYV